MQVQIREGPVERVTESEKSVGSQRVKKYFIYYIALSSVSLPNQLS